MVFKFFPSEIARLVLGYLKDSQCPQSWQTFLSESPDLQEYYRIYQEGEEYPTVVDGKSLIETLQEYRHLRDEVQRNTENHRHIRQDGSSASISEVFKSPRKSAGNQRAHSQSTITSIHYTQSREKSPRPSDNVTSTPSRVRTPKCSKRLQGVHVTHLNFDAGKENNVSGNESNEISRKLIGAAMRTPSRNISTSWAFRATTPSRQMCQTDPVRRRVNLLPRTPRTDPVAKSKDPRDPQNRPFNHSSQKEPISHLPGQENANLNSNATQTEEPLKNQRLNASSEAGPSGMQSSIRNQSITLRTSEVTRSGDNVTITATKSSYTPQNEGEPPTYQRAPDTNSPRLVLSYDRSQISSLSTPMKDRRSWTEDFASPKRKGFIPRRRLMNESPNSKQTTSNDLSLNSLPELNFSFLEEFLNNPPLVQKIADNINKAIHNDEPTVPEGSISTGYPSLQDIHGSEEIIKSVLARTEADPMFDQCLSLLYSSREWDDINPTQESSNLGNSDHGASSSIPAETPDLSVLNTPTTTIASSSRIEATKNTSDANIQTPKKVIIQDDPTRRPLQIVEQEKTTEAASTSHDNNSVSNPPNGDKTVIANGNSSVAPISTTESSVAASTSDAQVQNQVVDKKQDLNTPSSSSTLDVLDSCMAIIQPDPEGAVQDDEESSPVVASEPEFLMDIEDKTIKQVPIGTPCQLETQMAPDQTASGNTILNPTTPTSVLQSQSVSFVSTPVQSSQIGTPMQSSQIGTPMQSSQNRNVTILPAVQNVGNMFSTLNPSPTLPYSSVPTIFIPTMASNPFNLQSNFPYGIVVNSGNNWYCSNSMSNNVVMPVQNLPTIAKNAPIQSMPVVNQSPIKIPNDYSPTKAFCGDGAVSTDNIGNFVTIPASGTEKQPKTIVNKNKPKSLVRVAPSKIKKAKNKKVKNKKKKKALFPTPSKEMLENIVSTDVGDFPVLSIPEPSPGKSCSLSAMELFNNITENKCPQSPLLKEVLSRAKILAGRGSITNSSHVRTLEFASPNPKASSLKNSKLPQSVTCERRRSSPRLKQKTACKSPCCSPVKKQATKVPGKEKMAGEDKTQLSEKSSSAPISGTPEKKSPPKSVSMAEAVLVAMELAVQSKPLNTTKSCKESSSKGDASGSKSSSNKSDNKDAVKKPQIIKKSPKKSSPNKSSRSVKTIEQFFPSNLTDSDSDSDLTPLSKLITDEPTIPNKSPIKKASKPATPSSKEDSLNESGTNNEVIENSEYSLVKNSNISNTRRTIPRKAKNQGRLRPNQANSKIAQSSKNPITLSKPFVFKSPSKVSCKVESNSRDRLSKSSPKGEQCDKMTEQIPSTIQKDCKTSNKKQLNKNDNSEIKISLKNKHHEQKEKILKDKEKTKGVLEEVSNDLILSENITSVLSESHSNEDIVKSIEKEKVSVVTSLSNNQLHLKNAGTQKQGDLDIELNKEAQPFKEKVCLDDTLSIGTINSSELVQPTVSPKEKACLDDTLLIATANSSEFVQPTVSLKEKACLDDTLLITTTNSSEFVQPTVSPKEKACLDDTLLIATTNSSEFVQPMASPKEKACLNDTLLIATNNSSELAQFTASPKSKLSENSPQSSKHIKDSPKSITNKQKNISLKNAILSKPVSPLISPKPGNKNSLQSIKHRNDSSKTTVEDSHVNSLASPINVMSKKQDKSPAGKGVNVFSKEISQVHQTPKSNMQKHEKEKQSPSISSNHVIPVTSESLKNAGVKASKSQTLCATADDKETDSNNLKSSSKMKNVSNSDTFKVTPLPLKKILPPPKKRIRPIPVTSPSDGGFSPFSPFSSPAHVSTADIVSAFKAKTPTLVNDSTSVSTPNIAEPRLKLPSGKPKAMAEFYKAALPERSTDLPISPDTVSSSSCTLDSFLARKMLTGSCAVNANAQISATPVTPHSLSAKETPKKKLSANNLKYLFTDKSNSFSPLKMPHNVLYPSSKSSLFAFFNHGDSTLTADENSVKSPLKKDFEIVTSTSLLTQKPSSSKEDVNSSDEEGEIVSPTKTSSISKSNPVRNSPFTFPIYLSPYKKALPIKNKRKSSPMKALVINDTIISPSSAVSSKGNQDHNVPPIMKEYEKISSEKTVNAYNLLSSASLMLPAPLNPSINTEPLKDGLKSSDLKTVTCNDNVLTSLSMSSKKRKHSLSPENAESCKKQNRFVSQKRRKLSSSPEIEESGTEQNLGNTELSLKLSQNSPVRSLVAFKETKPKSWKQRNVEQNPRIPAGVKIPSKWDHTKISTYKTSIENQSAKEESRKEQISTKNRRRPTQKHSFQSPNKAYKTHSKSHTSLPSQLKKSKKSNKFLSTRNLDQKQSYKSRSKLEDYRFSYRNSPRKYGRPTGKQYCRPSEGDEKVFKETSPKSKRTSKSRDKSVEHEIDKDAKKSFGSATPKDKCTPKNKNTTFENNYRSSENLSKKTDHSLDCAEKKVVNAHLPSSPKDKCDNPKMKRKTDNKLISDDILETPPNSLHTQKPIPQYEETEKVFCENKPSTSLLDETKSSFHVASENVREPEHNFGIRVEEPKDCESRTSTDQNELNEAVAFLTHDNDQEESQKECKLAIQAPLIDDTSNTSGSDYVQEQNTEVPPEKVLSLEAEGSNQETTGSAEMDLAYLLKRINAVGGFEKLREVMRRKQ